MELLEQRLSLNCGRREAIGWRQVGTWLQEQWKDCHLSTVGGGLCTRPLGARMAEWSATDLWALLLFLLLLSLKIIKNYYMPFLLSI